MKHDEIDIGEYAVDLLYPSKEKRTELKQRRAVLSKNPQDYINNLELSTVASIINSYNVNTTISIFSELCDDVDVLNYRLDIIEDFINIPSLGFTVKKIIDAIVVNDRRNIYNLSSPDSFDTLNTAIESFESYIRCVELMHEFNEKNNGVIKSFGVKKLILFFEDQYNDKKFVSLRKNLDTLKGAIHDGIRSVTVAINLDDRMVPISAGIVDYSSEPYILKPSLFDKILYHGANFSSDKLLKTIKNKYNESEVSKEKIINTADENLFKELSFITDKYVELIDKVLSDYQKIGFKDMYHLNYQLEFYMGAVNLINLCSSCGLKMCRPHFLPAENRSADIKGLFDLVYFSKCRAWNIKNKEKKNVVPNDISFDDNGRMYILTGANNGGKTTFVRAVGICQVLAQSGLYVPCEECNISLCDYIFTHFPKEEQLGIDSSKFTSEIKDFKLISETISENSLLLMNESIQSTTPNECIAVAKELLNIFCIIGARGVFATHLIDLADFIEDINSNEHNCSKVDSLVMTVDENTGERLYKVSKAMPSKSSYADTILSKYGFSIDEIIAMKGKR